MTTHRAILRYKAGRTDITVYAKCGTNSVGYIRVQFAYMDRPIRLNMDEARELQHTLNWCMQQAGGGE